MTTLKSFLLIAGAVLAVLGVYCCTDTYLSKVEQIKGETLSITKCQAYAASLMRIHMIFALVCIVIGTLK